MYVYDIRRWMGLRVSESRKKVNMYKKNPYTFFYEDRKDWMTHCLDPDWKFLGPEDFVCQHGRNWKPQPFPPGYRLGRLGDCGRNACRLALRNPDLTYVEGYATSDRFNVFGHSWVVDAE